MRPTIEDGPTCGMAGILPLRWDDDTLTYPVSVHQGREGHPRTTGRSLFTAKYAAHRSAQEERPEGRPAED